MRKRSQHTLRKVKRVRSKRTRAWTKRKQTKGTRTKKTRTKKIKRKKTKKIKGGAFSSLRSKAMDMGGSHLSELSSVAKDKGTRFSELKDKGRAHVSELKDKAEELGASGQAKLMELLKPFLEGKYYGDIDKILTQIISKIPIRSMVAAVAAASSIGTDDDLTDWLSTYVGGVDLLQIDPGPRPLLRKGVTEEQIEEYKEKVRREVAAKEIADAKIATRAQGLQSFESVASRVPAATHGIQKSVLPAPLPRRPMPGEEGPLGDLDWDNGWFGPDEKKRQELIYKFRLYSGGGGGLDWSRSELNDPHDLARVTWGDWGDTPIHDMEKTVREQRQRLVSQLKKGIDAWKARRYSENDEGGKEEDKTLPYGPVFELWQSSKVILDKEPEFREWIDNEVGRLLEEAEKKTPVRLGEINDEMPSPDPLPYPRPRKRGAAPEGSHGQKKHKKKPKKKKGKKKKGKKKKG